MQPKGLRFEIFLSGTNELKWRFVGKENEIVCASVKAFSTEEEVRSDIAKCRRKMKAAGFSKVFNVYS